MFVKCVCVSECVCHVCVCLVRVFSVFVRLFSVCLFSVCVSECACRVCVLVFIRHDILQRIVFKSDYFESVKIL